MMKWTLIIIGSLVAIVLLVTVVGALLPRDHVARSYTLLRAAPDTVWQTITDVAGAPAWRDVQKVEVLTDGAGPLRWREHGKYGPITFEQIESVRPSKFVARIADTDQGFGGTWTYDIVPEGKGSRVTITENGFVTNPIFRFMSRFVFGYHGTQEEYLRALGKKFGETADVQRK
jgi:uncharacterized protein YndB with AHSA1/START domain